jgi:hypothetical protein
LPATSGHIGDEELLALCDLKVAHELSPESQEITRAYVSLSLQVDEHRMKEKEMYQRAFRKNAELGEKDKEREKEKKVAKGATSTNEHGQEQKGAEVEKLNCNDSTPLDGAPVSVATDGSASVAGAEGGAGDKNVHTGGAAGATAKKKPKEKEKEKKVKPKSDADGAGSGDKDGDKGDKGGADKKPIVKPTMTAKSQEKNKMKSPEESMASARAAISTIEEAISRIKEVEARAEQLRQEGRHADALILTEKVKAAKAHIENLYEQQAKAEKIHQQYLEQQARAQGEGGDNALVGEGDMRLRGNLFNINFMSPPPGIIADAKAHGLDLADRRCGTYSP